MSQLVVSASELKKKHQDLSTHKKTFENQIRSFREASNKLNSMWEGEAKDKFQHSVDMDIDKLMRFVAVLLDIITILSTIIKMYEDMERKNVQTASGN